MARWHLEVEGVVQGVGFRPFVYNLAGSLGLSGWIRNTSAGVEMEMQGSEAAIAQFLNRLGQDGPPLARILAVEKTAVPEVAGEPAGLVIRPSQAVSGRTLVSPDVATCRQCLAEMVDPADRRYHYPFTNCTHCGPRYTIITGLPYDRPLTTMAAFPLCPVCAAEYHDPADRRFHAQPVACPLCGPQVWFVRASEAAVSGDVFESAPPPITAAADCLAQGGIVALKGLGGFHLACRADNGSAVERLRSLKDRPAKALAIMVGDLDEARKYGEVNLVAADLLTAPEAPIVLLRKTATTQARPGLAPNLAAGNAAIGVMLPYTPLHHLLLRAANAPLVMTSGNRRGEPLCITNEDALKGLDGCDGFLLHNRPVARRCDDSVIMVADLGDEVVSQPVRRSRGYTPLPLLLPAALNLERPLVAAGAELKNVPAVATGRTVFLGQHVGNLSSPAVRAEHGRVIADLEQLFQVGPTAVVCDLHPDYAASGYARRRAEAEGLALIEVQHHQAHLAGCLAENGYSGRAIGLAFDGTGYGSDGRIWGGEVLLVSLSAAERLYHLEYLPLPGGEAAIHHPQRIAIAYLQRLLPEVDTAGLFPDVPAQEIRNLQMMVAQQWQTPLTSSMGRLFDAVSALLGICQVSDYEAQAAIALEQAAGSSQATGHYDFEFIGDEIRLAPLFAQLIRERQVGVAAADSARRFHHTVAEMALVAAGMACDRLGGNEPAAIALSGGVWQNRLLLELAVPRLRRAGFRVLLHRQVPANDGGLAYGQVVVAAARLRAATL